MKHGEQLAPLIEALLPSTAWCARTSPPSPSASAPARSPASGSAWSPPAPSPWSSSSRSTASARSTCWPSRRSTRARSARTSWSPPTPGARRSTSRRTTPTAPASPAPRSSGPPTPPPSARSSGEGAVLYPDAFPHAVGPARPSAGWLARVVAEERAELLDPEPLYLRRPDAVVSAGRSRRGRRAREARGDPARHPRRRRRPSPTWSATPSAPTPGTSAALLAELDGPGRRVVVVGRRPGGLRRLHDARATSSTCSGSPYAPTGGAAGSPPRCSTTCSPTPGPPTGCCWR